MGSICSQHCYTTYYRLTNQKKKKKKEKKKEKKERLLRSIFYKFRSFSDQPNATRVLMEPTDLCENV